jgi:hypothetical protein
MEKVEVEFERESCLKDISKILVKSRMPALQRASLMAQARETMLLEDSLFLHSQNYEEVPTSLIEDNLEKMREDYRMQGGNYK